MYVYWLAMYLINHIDMHNIYYDTFIKVIFWFPCLIETENPQAIHIGIIPLVRIPRLKERNHVQVMNSVLYILNNIMTFSLKLIIFLKNSRKTCKKIK